MGTVCALVSLLISAVGPVLVAAPAQLQTDLTRGWPLWPIVLAMLVTSTVLALVLLRRWLAAGTGTARVRR